MSSSHFIPERGPDGKIALDPPRPTLAELLPEAPADAPAAPATAHAPARVSPKQQQIAIYVAIILVAILAGTLLSRLIQAPASVANPPRELPATPASAPPTPHPTALATLDRAVVAYAAPDGQVLGALEAGRTYTPIARYGTSWAQLDIGEAAPIWVRLGDLPALTVAGLPDLAPRPTQVPPPVVVEEVAPALVPAGPCTEDRANFHSSKRVERDGVPIGEVTAWSCVSQADADNQVAAQEAAMLAGR